MFQRIRKSLFYTNVKNLISEPITIWTLSIVLFGAVIFILKYIHHRPTDLINIIFVTTWFITLLVSEHRVCICRIKNRACWRMPSSRMLRRVVVVRTGVLEEFSASIKVTTIGELGTMLAATNNRRILRRRITSYGWRCSHFIDSCHFDGGAKFLRNVGSYKSYTA
jgi:hypothetical protein